MPPSKSSSPKPSHARLSPSASHRWLKCRASVGFLEKNAHRLPKESGSSVYADEGTLAHDYAAHLLAGAPWKGAPISSEMEDAVSGYVSYIRMQAKTMDNPTLHVERRVPLFYAPDEEGTVDAALTTKSSCFVFDLKYGQGVSVEARNNPQLAIYFTSLVRLLGIKLSPSAKITLVIYQPRAEDGRFVRKWETTWGELQEKASDIQFVADSIAIDPDGQEFHVEPEHVCRWCKAKPICTHYAAHLLGEAPEVVAETLQIPAPPTPDLPLASTLSLEQVSRVVRAKRDLVAWLESVEDYAMALEGDGTDVPGVKLVAGKGGGRQWSVPEDEVVKLLRKYITRDKLFHPATVVSPAQAEKLLPKKADLPTRFLNRFAQSITKPAGRPTLVVDEDPRPALDMNPVEGFTDLTTTDIDTSLL